VLLPSAMNMSPQVSPRLVAEVERLGRRLGLPLSTLELIGQNAKVAREFIVNARAGKGAGYVATLNLENLQNLLDSRERRFGFHLTELPRGVAPLL